MLGADACATATGFAARAARWAAGAALCFTLGFDAPGRLSERAAPTNGLLPGRIASLSCGTRIRTVIAGTASATSASGAIRFGRARTAPALTRALMSARAGMARARELKKSGTAPSDAACRRGADTTRRDVRATARVPTEARRLSEMWCRDLNVRSESAPFDVAATMPGRPRRRARRRSLRVRTPSRSPDPFALVSHGRSTAPPSCPVAAGRKPRPSLTLAYLGVMRQTPGRPEVLARSGSVGVPFRDGIPGPRRARHNVAGERLAARSPPGARRPASWPRFRGTPRRGPAAPYESIAERRRRRHRRRRVHAKRRIAIGLGLVIILVVAAAAGGGLFVGNRYLAAGCSLKSLRPISLGPNSFLLAKDGSLLGVDPGEEEPAAADARARCRRGCRRRRSRSRTGASTTTARSTTSASRAPRWPTCRPGGSLQGASTLTQQLARNLYIGNQQRTISRKLEEACLAMKLEDRWTKKRILAAYLNQVFYGNQAYGVEAASQTYFSRPARAADARAGGADRRPAAGADASSTRSATRSAAHGAAQRGAAGDARAGYLTPSAVPARHARGARA